MKTKKIYSKKFLGPEKSKSNKDFSRKQEELIFLGIIIILVGILLKILSGLLTFIIIVIGAYFVIKGIIKLDKSNKKKR